MAIPRVGGLLISGTDNSLPFVSGELEAPFGVKVVARNDAIYSGMGLK